MRDFRIQNTKQWIFIFYIHWEKHLTLGVKQETEAIIPEREVG